MELKQFEYFVHVAELGSFTKAAALLSVAQPALSRHVRQLEVELRQPLLYRTGHGVIPTDAGKRFLEHARGILLQIERSRQDLNDARDTPVGQVVVGAPPTIIRTLAPALVPAFRSRFPKATLRIVEGLSAYILESIAAGRMDLGLVYNPMLSPAIETHPLANARLHLICPPSKQQSKARPNCPVTLKSLANYPLIIPSRPNAIRMLLETSLASAGVKSHVAWEIDGVSSILDLVNAGHGFAVLPLNALDGHKAAGRLIARPVVKPSLSCMIGLSASSHRRLTPLAQCVRDLISETMRYVLPEDQGQKCRSRILNRNP